MSRLRLLKVYCFAGFS